MTCHILHIPEIKIEGKRLGRHIEHDPRSRNFALVRQQKPLVSKIWPRYVGPFSQGEVGSCTGNALAGCAVTAPFWNPARMLTEADALKCYEAATRLDKIHGVYPPDDTGSTGIAAAKAGVRLGWFRGYHHAFDLQTALEALAYFGPVAIGINWYAGFDNPRGPHAELHIAGGIRGGHEVMLNEVDVSARMVRGCNSWGAGWGDNGYFTMTFDTFEALLQQSGDVTIPVL